MKQHRTWEWEVSASSAEGVTAELGMKRLQWYRREPMGGHASLQDIADFLAHGPAVPGVPPAVLDALEAYLVDAGFTAP